MTMMFPPEFHDREQARKLLQVAMFRHDRIDGAFALPSRFWRLYSSATAAGSTDTWEMSIKSREVTHLARDLRLGSVH